MICFRDKIIEKEYLLTENELSFHNQINNSSVYFSLSKDKILFSSDERLLLKKPFEPGHINEISFLKYLFSDNLVSRNISESIYKNIFRLQANSILKVKKDSPFKIELFEEKDIKNSNLEDSLLESFNEIDSGKKVGLLYSGGLDSCLISTVLENNCHILELYHLDYHGIQSRTEIIADEISRFFGKRMKHIFFDDGNFPEAEDMINIFKKNFNGIQSGLQFALNKSLKAQIVKDGVEVLVTGQNADTLMYVDHYFPPTQLILFERFLKTLTGIPKRLKKVFESKFRSKNIYKDPNFYSLSEHCKSTEDIQIYIENKYKNELKGSFKKNTILSTRKKSKLEIIKNIRWFRSCASVNDNYQSLEDQSGIKRISLFNSQIFLNYSLSHAFSVFNLIICKYEFAKLFFSINKISHRMLVIKALFRNYKILLKSKDERIKKSKEIQKKEIKLLKDILEEINIEELHSFIEQSIDDSYIKDYLKDLLKKSLSEPYERKVILRLVNMYVYLY